MISNTNNTNNKATTRRGKEAGSSWTLDPSGEKKQLSFEFSSSVNINTLTVTLTCCVHTHTHTHTHTLRGEFDRVQAKWLTAPSDHNLFVWVCVVRISKNLLICLILCRNSQISGAVTEIILMICRVSNSWTSQTCPWSDSTTVTGRLSHSWSFRLCWRHF